MYFSDSPLRKRHCSATDDYMGQRIKVDEARHQHELALRKLELDHAKHEAEEERKLRREELAAQKTKEDAMLKLITELVKNKSN